jgi:DHA2 family multidrug resistance protein
LAAVALIGTFAFVKDLGSKGEAQLDWTGFLTLAVAVTSLQLLMDRGEMLDWLDSGEILVLIFTMCMSFYLFVVHTFTHDKPFISPSLFLDRNFSIGLFVVFVYGMLNFTPIVLLPPLLQNLKGYPDSLIGFLLAMRGAGLTLGFFFAMRMGRLDPRIGLIIGMLCIGVSGVYMTQFDLNVPIFEIAWVVVLQGFGCSILWVPLTIVTFATLPERLLPEGSAIFHLLRNFGTSIFVSISVMLVTRTAKFNYADMSAGVSVYNETLRIPGVLGDWNMESLRGLAAIGGEIHRQSRMIGYDNAFLLYTLISIGIIPLVAFIRVKQR